jgi:hypothetical protein
LKKKNQLKPNEAEKRKSQGKYGNNEKMYKKSVILRVGSLKSSVKLTKI